MSKQKKTAEKIPVWVNRIKDPIIKENKDKIPIYSPYLKGKERTYLKNCFTSTWISSKGNYVRDYEKKFASFCGAPYVVSTSSGTSALFLALKILGVGKNDEVIIPTFTMISTAFAVSYTGAIPIFVDCYLKDGNINTDKIEEKITKNTKAILPVHIYGNPCNLSQIYSIAKKNRVNVVEDAAEAIGSEYLNKKIGGTGQIACFSTYVNKIITTGEGGMVTLNNKKQYIKLKQMNNYYFSPKRHFWHQGIGYNFRISNLQAAIGLAQLENVNKVLNLKKKIFQTYKRLLKPINELFFPLKENPQNQSNYWHVAFRVRKEKYNIFKLRRFLAKNKIETRTFFIPLHLQPPYRNSYYYGKFPNSEELAKTGILLPSGPNLTENQIEKISKLITDYFLH